VLRDGWWLRSSALVKEDGATLSTRPFRPEQWLAVSVPTTVLSALVKNGVYPDPRVGLNAYQIPDSSDEFNRQYDLARFSYLPDQRNPWRDPYWYRTEFRLSSLLPGRRLWLHFDAINYRAAVWLNGTRIADRDRMAGMFQRFQLDITDQARPGWNVLAVQVYPVDHPGTPDRQLEVLGKDRGYVGKEIMRDVTEIMTIGYDCMMTVPDRNLGLWQDVWLDWTGPVDIRDPFVVTDLPLPETDRAQLTVSVQLVNAAAAPVKGTLRGRVAETDVRFEQAVELGPNETKVVVVDPRPVMRNPRLWWPRNYGDQYLYEMKLQFELGDGAGTTASSVRSPDFSRSEAATKREPVQRPNARPPEGGTTNVSDEERVRFGVREVGYEMHERNGWQGRRVLVNGQKIFCRGGYIQPELLFDWDARRLEAEIRYYAQANLNLIYFEDIPNPPAPFLELCDRYGILFGNVFYSCFWLRPGTPYPDDFSLLERCTADLIKRYRNHPSLILYMAMNEEDTKEPVYEMWRRHLLALDGTRWFIPSAYFPSDRQNVGAWFQKDLPTGMTDKGASYSWAEPERYFQWVREARNWMFMMESGSASLPPISSLSRFLTNVNARSAGEKLFPLDAAWAHHGANHYYKGYDSALRRLHGEPESVADYCWKGHLVTADQHRSMFEAVNHRLWDITSGFTQWKINACEPSVQWQIFDWYHKPMVSWFFIKKACEPLHVQLNLPDRTVSVINTRLVPQPQLTVRARLFDRNARLLWEKTAPASVPANAFAECFTVSEPPGSSPVYFVKLELIGPQGRLLSDNFYWLRAQGVADFQALQSLPAVQLEGTCRVEAHGDEKVARITVNNPSDRLALFVQLALTRGTRGPEIVPVIWDDNYFSLLPGESRQITARFSAQDAGRGKAALELGGWNIASEVQCSALTVSPSEAKAGEPVTVTAQIANTFLDGSRVTLLHDGEPAASKWAWARAGQRDRVTFQLRFDEIRRHRIQVGNKTAVITVR